MATYPIETYVHNVRRYALAASVAELSDGSDWYDLAHEVCADIAERTGLSVDTVAAIVSALSPRNKWARNLVDAAAFAEAAVSGRPMPKACTFMPNRLKAWAIATGTPWRTVLKGIKVESFIANIALGDRVRVTVDVWAVRGATAGAEDVAGCVGRYRAIESAYQTVAAELGMEPANLQAIVWLVCKDRTAHLKGRANTLAARVAALS